jgi:hypothetical protein
VQLRNSGGFSVPQGQTGSGGLVDTSGYASDVQAKYQGFLITEVKLNIAGTELRPGDYGFGFSQDGKFLVMDVGATICSASLLNWTKSWRIRAPENRRRRKRLPAVRRPQVGQHEARVVEALVSQWLMRP